jgi:pilus assembly protein CpaE
MSGLVVASPSEGFDVKIADAFGDKLNGHRRYWRDGLLDGNPVTAVAELTRSAPDVVAIGPDLPIGDAIDLAEAFDAERPDIVIVLVAEPSIQLYERALRSGARDIVAPDAPDADLRLAFEQALGAADRRRNAIANTDAPASSSHVICVVSPKGGTGKTTVSTNVAMGLALAAPGEVVIVDLDLQFGDVASALKLTPELTFRDISRTPLTLDETMVKTFLTSHESGLYALCAPQAPVDADAITAEQAHQIVSLLASEFRFVVIDTGSGLDEPTLAVLELCTDIIVLTSTDVPSVRATRKEVETFDLLGLTAPTRHFVVNRSDARVGLGLSDIERTVGLRANVAIPSSRLVPVSVNQGTPVVVSDPRSGVSDALSTLVARFTAMPQPDARWSGLSLRKKKRKGDR